MLNRFLSFMDRKNDHFLLRLIFVRLTYHYNNSILSDPSSRLYQEALKYALLTSSQFIEMGNFSLALEYLEYAGTVAKTEDEFRRILTTLYTAERFVHPRQEDDPQEREGDSEISQMFYQRTTEGCPTADYYYADFIHLRDRLITHLPLQTSERNSIYPITFSSHIRNNKPNSVCIIS